MSLSSPYQEHYYVADGVTTTFAFGSDFTALSSSYVKCIIYFDDGTNCVPTFNVDLTTGYISIVTLTKPDGTVLTVPPAGSIVRVFRDVPEQQNVTASQLQNYTAKQLEKIFDSVVAMIQEVSYSDLHKTIRLTETQRDVAVEQLTEAKDQAVLYWDFDSRTLKATDYGQDEIVKSETVDRLVYLQPEGKIYFIPKGSNNPIAIGSATIHNDLGGRNAPDCHPESAITNLTTHLQELRDRDTAIEYKADQALSKAGEALDTANHADANATYAVNLATTFDGRLTQAESDASEAKTTATNAKTAVDNHIANKNNPHEVTKAQLGLGNVDNTSDLDKPISTATQAVLTAQQEEIDALSGRGRFLSVWNCATGLPETDPEESPYEYKSGDYFIVGAVGATNYKPDGSSYTTGVPSTTIETAEVKVDDLYIYDGTNWKLLASSQRTYTFAGIAGSPYDNTNLSNALNAKQDTLTAGTGIDITGATISNSGVRSVASGTTNGTISVNTNGTSADVSVTGLGSAAYTASSAYATATQGGKADTAVQPSDLATIATTGDYDDLLNKPTIPTVNDATLTIQKNGTNVATFTANSSTNATANISVPTDTGDLTNGAGFITGITSSDVTNALGYTPYSDANPNGYTSNVGTVTSVNSVSPDGSGNVSLTIPTVNDATITITQGGVTKGSFTLNQASGDTIALDAGGGVGNIDNLTITENASQEIQAVATINANTAVGATNPLYDWVGTLAEYEAQDIETNHPEWVCYITDDFTAQAYNAYTKSETNNMFVQKGHEVIEFQEPNAGNNYTWYRKYADGWVEQGGIGTLVSNSYTANLPVEMADTNYIYSLAAGVVGVNTAVAGRKCTAKTTASMTILGTYAMGGGTNYDAGEVVWEVKGMAA